MMLNMDSRSLFLFIFANKTAAYYAICFACVFTPLYMFVLNPLLAWLSVRVVEQYKCCRERCKEHRAAKVAEREATPHRSSSSPRGRASSGSRVSSASQAATATTPPKSKSPRSRKSRSPPSSSSSSDDEDIVEPCSPSINPGNYLMVYGQQLKLAVPNAAARASLWVTSIRSNYFPARSACAQAADPALAEAMASGEVYYRPKPKVLMMEQHVRHLFSRYHRSRQYEASDITRASLEALYERPAFQAWYADNRETLLEEVQMRREGMLWRSVATVAVFLVALLALPAFSFSNKGRVTMWGSAKAAGLDAQNMRAATFSQIAYSRAEYVMKQRKLPCLFTVGAYVGAGGAFNTIFSEAEMFALVGAVCLLLTSAFMPRHSRRTATAGLIGLVVLLAECACVEGVIVKVGLGLLAVLGVVAISIVKAMN